MMEVHVITHLESGWDCVCGVWESYDKALEWCTKDLPEDATEEEREEAYEDSMYVIHTKTLK